MKLFLNLTVTTILLSAFVNNPDYNSKVSFEEASILAFQIQNYQELSIEQQQSLKKEIFLWENNEEIQKISLKNRLPHSILFLKSSELEVNVIYPSPFVKRPVCWIPDVKLFYDLMLVNNKMITSYGENRCPSIYLIMLTIIVSIAILSAPFPFQQLAFEQPNVAVLRFPYILLPSVIVPLVYLSHFITLKWLANNHLRQ